MLWVMFEYFMASLKRRNFAVFPTADKSKFEVVDPTCTHMRSKLGYLEADGAYW